MGWDTMAAVSLKINIVVRVWEGADGGEQHADSSGAFPVPFGGPEAEISPLLLFPFV